MTKAKGCSRLCRPPRDATNVLKLSNNGRWIVDDGKPGRAFSGEHKDTKTTNPDFSGWPTAWACECACDFDHRCNFEKATDKTAERFGCSNGQTRPEVRT